MSPERQASLLKRRNLLLTKGGVLSAQETLWLVRIEMELGIT